jgi:type I restriction-modification system DNA methylase subunit
MNNDIVHIVEIQDHYRNVEGLTSVDAFEEVIKIIFTKIYLENKKSKVDVESIKNIYSDEVCKTYDFFNSCDFKSKDITVRFVLDRLENLDFNNLDVKGKFFELYLGRVFTADLGQFFTPKTVVRFINDVLKTFIDDNEKPLKYFDPASGSAGFLSDFKLNNVEYYGTDINERLCRVARMNLNLLGLTNSTIINDSFLNLSDDYDNYFDVIGTNPPFGVAEKQKQILDTFIFGRNKKQEDLEVLFLEKIIRVLKPGGICGVVVPDGIINNPTNLDIRNYLTEKCKILLCVDLPENVFKSSGTGVETSIIFFQKKTEQVQENYDVLMSRISNVGYETKTKFSRKIESNDFELVVNSIKEKKYDSEILFLQKINDLNKRFDPKYFSNKFLFEDDFISISECVEFSGVKNIKSTSDEEVNYIQYSDIDDEFGVIKSATKIPMNELPSRAKIKVSTGDILIPRLKQSGDKVSIVYEEQNGDIVTNGFLVLKPKNGYSSQMIYAISKTELVQRQLKNLTSGSIMPAVSDEFFSEIKIPSYFKNKKVIDEITECIVSVEENRKSIRQKLKNKVEELNTLKKVSE